MILGQLDITTANAPTLRHALELAIRRGSYTAREESILRETVDDLLLLELEAHPAPNGWSEVQS